MPHFHFLCSSIIFFILDPLNRTFIENPKIGKLYL